MEFRNFFMFLSDLIGMVLMCVGGWVKFLKIKIRLKFLRLYCICFRWVILMLFSVMIMNGGFVIWIRYLVVGWMYMLLWKGMLLNFILWSGMFIFNFLFLFVLVILLVKFLNSLLSLLWWWCFFCLVLNLFLLLYLYFCFLLLVLLNWILVVLW